MVFLFPRGTSSSPTLLGKFSRPTSQPKSNTAVVAGGVIGALVTLALIALTIFFCLRRRGRRGLDAVHPMGGRDNENGVLGSPEYHAISPFPTSPRQSLSITSPSRSYVLSTHRHSRFLTWVVQGSGGAFGRRGCSCPSGDRHASAGVRPDPVAAATTGNGAGEFGRWYN